MRSCIIWRRLCAKKLESRLRNSSRGVIKCRLNYNSGCRGSSLSVLDLSIIINHKLMLTRNVRLFSSKFLNEKDLRSALVKSGFIHAKKVGFNDECLALACSDFGYPSVSNFSQFVTFCFPYQVTASVVRKGPIEVVDYAMQTWLH